MTTPILDGGMALHFVQACPAQDRAHVHQHVISHLGRLTDDHAHAMVDEETLADFCSGVNLHAGQEASDVGAEPCEKKEIMSPEEVRDPVHPDGMQARIAGDYL